jgi:hypothetical protein
MTDGKTPGRQVSRSGLKFATFTVKADASQSARWKQAAQAEGFASVGSWLARAADAHLKARATAGQPVPLGWSRGHFRVLLEGGEAEVSGFISPPFGAFRGLSSGPVTRGQHRHTLVYLPERRILATLAYMAECKALASDLARQWVAWGGKEPPGKPAGDAISAALR